MVFSHVEQQILKNSLCIAAVFSQSSSSQPIDHCNIANAGTHIEIILGVKFFDEDSQQIHPPFVHLTSPVPQRRLILVYV